MLGKSTLSLFQQSLENLRAHQAAGNSIATELENLKKQVAGSLGDDEHAKAFSKAVQLGLDANGLVQSPATQQLAQQFAAKIAAAPNTPQLVQNEATKKFNHAVLKELLRQLEQKQQIIEQRLGQLTPNPRRPSVQTQVDKLKSILSHLDEVQKTIKTALQSPANTLSTDQDLITASSKVLNQLNAGATAKELADEYFSATMLNAPIYAEHLRKQEEVQKRLQALPATTDPNAQAQLNEVDSLLTDLARNAPADESPQFTAAQQKYQELAAKVVAFDPATDTHFATQHRTIPDEFTQAYNELNSTLATIQKLCIKQSELAATLNTPMLLSPDQLAQKERDFAETQKTLQQAAQDLNKLLIKYSNQHYGVAGLSVFSSIQQQKLNNLVAFNKELLKKTGARSHRAKRYPLPLVAAALMTLYPVAGTAKVLHGLITTAYNNRDHNTIAGGRFELISDPAIMDAYNKPGTTTTSTGTWWPEKSHAEPLKDGEGNAIQLPIYGDKDLSIISLAHKVFGDAAPDHIRYNKDGSVTVTWDNKEQGEAWLKAIKEANVKYLKQKDAIKASLTTEAPQQVKAALSATAATPSAPPVNAGRPAFIPGAGLQNPGLAQLMQQMQQQSLPREQQSSATPTQQGNKSPPPMRS